jgi:hypothetical protein
MATPDEVDLKVRKVADAVIALTGAVLSLRSAVSYVRNSLQHPGIPAPLSAAVDVELLEANQRIIKAINSLDGI